jgi:F-type H+-transporting ATPase subunit delta
MKISKQARRDGKTLFNACRVNGVLDEDRIRRAVAQVIAHKPRGYVAMLQHFHRLVKLDLARRTVRVENAVETTPAQRQAINTSLAQRYGQGLATSFHVNPALIGGLRVRVGSDIYDGSVAGRLAALESAL